MPLRYNILLVPINTNNFNDMERGQENGAFQQDEINKVIKCDTDIGSNWFGSS